jgi:hypothetical protein
MSDKVTLKYIGSPLVRRIIDEYEWSPDNGHLAEVPLELAADLLTSREAAEWELAEKPKPAVLRRLAEEMGAPPEFIPIAETEDDEVKNDG